MRIILNSILALGFACIAHAETYNVGSKLAAFNAKDQHGNAFTLDTNKTRFLLVSFDMETGKKANAALSALGRDYLPAKRAVYVANIHGMPGIGRAFALPKMRKYPHQIILADDANLLTPIPQQASKVTLIELQNGKVAKVSYWDPSAAGIDTLLK